MNEKVEITGFVEDIFDLYNADKYGFFYEIDEDSGELMKIELFADDDIDNETLGRLSVKLGMTKDEILNLDEMAARKYWDKYPFFELYSRYKERWFWNSHYKETLSPVEAFLYVLENETFEIPAEERYDYKSVKLRMIEQLRAMDTVFPGTYHPNAEIFDLQIETEVLISFPEITKMIQSFIDMVERVEELFFKILKDCLTEEEINEYNFLVSWLRITDIVMPSVLVTYDNVCTYKEAYIEEGYSDFFSYVTVRSFVGTGELCKGVNPWRCKEFFDDMELVEKLANIFPEMKAQMRAFAMSVTNFSCTFAWSDANPVMHTAEEEEALKHIDMDTPMEERAKEYIKVYVPKNKKEMFGWEYYVSRINVVASPESKGGIIARKRDINSCMPYCIPRIQRRIELKNGGNAR